MGGPTSINQPVPDAATIAGWDDGGETIEDRPCPAGDCPVQFDHG